MDGSDALVGSISELKDSLSDLFNGWVEILSAGLSG
jgi:hypothetical protein